MRGVATKSSFGQKVVLGLIALAAVVDVAVLFHATHSGGNAGGVAAPETASGTNPIRIRARHATSPPLEERRQELERSNRQPKIVLESGFVCSTPLDVVMVSPTHFRVKIISTTRSFNYFLFKLTGVAGQTVRIDIEDAPLKKWNSLNPVFSYVRDLDDPRNYASSDHSGASDGSRAWNGATIPATSGQQWHYIPDTWGEPSDNPQRDRFCMVQSFEQDVAYVGMRVPYTPGYNGHIVASFAGASAAKVLDIGTSSDGNPLRAILISQGRPSAVPRPCVMIYAREHGTEPDSSWVAEGAIRFLLSDSAEANAARERADFVVIPVLDPDAAAASIYSGISDQFWADTQSVAPAAYISFFHKWFSSGRRVEVVLNLHNIESAERGHLWCPGLPSSPDIRAQGLALYRKVISAFSSAGYDVTAQMPRQIATPNRFGGYLSEMYGILHVPFEVNSQASARHLTIADLRDMGRLFVLAAVRYLDDAPPTTVPVRNSAAAN